MHLKLIQNYGDQLNHKNTLIFYGTVKMSKKKIQKIFKSL